LTNPGPHTAKASRSVRSARSIRPRPVPVVDLFAGPGGLGEGFSSLAVSDAPVFELRLSVEKEASAHQTLELRSFFRKFPASEIPEDYYRLLRGEIDRATLFGRHPDQAHAARQEAWCAELGSEGLSGQQLDSRIEAAIGNATEWVLIGGPPCQAYSVAGRSRKSRLSADKVNADPRHFLYREYLHVLGTHWPAVFVMENVTGILSSKVDGLSIFQRILEDLQNPREAIGDRHRVKKAYDGYRIYSLVQESRGFDLFGSPNHDPDAYVIESERYGIPQARHRVILLGVRHDIASTPPLLTPVKSPVTVRRVLEGLPRLRPGLTGAIDSRKEWLRVMRQSLREPWFSEVRAKAGEEVRRLIIKTVRSLSAPRHDRGGEFIRCRPACHYQSDWYVDERVQGVCNSATRAHIADDLYRYLYAACFTQLVRRSPRLSDFPDSLLPKHRNVSVSLGHGNFADRFRVQKRDEPATTVVSHIAKDGHYYIHYEPAQCRSLTVREAARLQTFPDNYFFCGNRTEQYTQVGNAVPPLLARQIADIVKTVLDTSRSLHPHG